MTRDAVTPGCSGSSTGDDGAHRVEARLRPRPSSSPVTLDTRIGHATWSGRSLWRRSNAITVVGRPRADPLYISGTSPTRASPAAPSRAASIRCARATWSRLRSTFRSSGSSTGGWPTRGVADRRVDLAERAELAGGAMARIGCLGQLGRAGTRRTRTGRTASLPVVGRPFLGGHAVQLDVGQQRRARSGGRRCPGPTSRTCDQPVVGHDRPTPTSSSGELVGRRADPCAGRRPPRA